jgi:hypothetical protein
LLFVSVICSVFKDPVYQHVSFSRALLFYHSDFSKSTVIYRKTGQSQTFEKPLGTNALKKPESRAFGQLRALPDPKQSQNIVIGDKDQQSHQQEEHQRM